MPGVPFTFTGGLNGWVLRRRGQREVRVPNGLYDDDAVVERHRLREEHGAGAEERRQGRQVGVGLPPEGNGGA